MTKQIFQKFLVIQGEGRKETTLDVSADRFFVGRSPECQVSLQGAKISRQHAEIWHNQGVVYIKDLGTRNGTWMDALKLEPNQEYPVTSGVQINCAGEKSFRLEVQYREEKIEVPIEDIPDIESKTVIRAINPEQSIQQIQVAEKKAEDIVSAARAESLKLIDQSRDEAKKIQTDSKLRAEALLKQTEEKARKLIQQVEQSVQERLGQAKIEAESIKKEAYNDGKYQVELERKKVISDAEETATNILARAESAVREIEVKKRERLEELEKIAERLNHVRAEYDKTEKELALAVTKTEAELKAKVEQTEKELTARVESTEKELATKISSTEKELATKVENTENALNLKVLTTERELREKVEQTEKNLAFKVQKTESDLALKVQKTESELALMSAKIDSIVEDQKQIVKDKELIQLMTADLNEQLGQISSKQQEAAATLLLAQDTMTKANTDSAKILAETEQKNKQKIEMFEAEFKAKVEAREVEFQKFKKDQEDLLHKQRQYEEKRIAQMLKEAEEAANSLKSEQSKQIISTMKDYFSKIVKATEAAPKNLDNTLAGELIDIVRKGLNNELNVQEAELKGLMEYNPYATVKQKKYWTKFAVAASFAVILGFVYMLKPHWLTILPKKFVSSITSMDKEDKEKLKKEQEQLIYNSKFHPLQDGYFRNTYFENVLYLQSYLDFEKNDDFQKRWIIAVNKLLLERIGANETVVARFIADEGNLINELSQLATQIDGKTPQVGIDRLIAKEKEFSSKIEYIGENERKEMRNIKKNLYTQFIDMNRAPASSQMPVSSSQIPASSSQVPAPSRPTSPNQ